MLLALSLAARIAAADVSPPLPSSAVRVWVKTPVPTAVLQRVERQGELLRTETCPGRCGALLDAGAVYRVAGDEVTPSALFRLPPGRAELTLLVRPGPGDLHLRGIGLFAAGIVVGVASLATYGGVRIADGSADARRNSLLVGAGGLALALTGGTVALASRTRFRFE